MSHEQNTSNHKNQMNLRPEVYFPWKYTLIWCIQVDEPMGNAQSLSSEIFPSARVLSIILFIP